jgi:hypothetical protein
MTLVLALLRKGSPPDKYPHFFNPKAGIKHLMIIESLDPVVDQALAL